MDATRPSLLTAGELARLGDLMFVARRLVEGLYAGRHASPRRGHSTEFYDFRGYVAGDEPRRVDWKLFGRTDRLYVRRYRHDAELTMHLAVDRSASMGFGAVEAGGARRSRGATWAERAGGSMPVTKWDYARQVAAALAFLAVRQGDRVSLTLLGEQVEPIVGVGGTAEHLQRLVRGLETAACAGRLEVERAMRELAGRVAGQRGAARRRGEAPARNSRGGRGLVILIGDLLDEATTWLEGIGGLAHQRLDVVVMQVLTPDELEVSGLGSRRLVDMETGRSLRTYGAEVAGRYERALRDHLEALREGLTRMGADYQFWTTNRPPLEALRGYVARRTS